MSLTTEFQCKRCWGAGTILTDVEYYEPHYVECPDCRGNRFDLYKVVEAIYKKLGGEL